METNLLLHSRTKKKRDIDNGTILKTKIKIQRKLYQINSKHVMITVRKKNHRKKIKIYK